MQNVPHPYVTAVPEGKAGAREGYVDTHVHIRDGSPLHAVFAAGIVALRDAGSRDAAGLRANSAEDRSGEPLIVSAGQALYKNGGYGPLLGVPIDTLDDIKREILRLNKAGAAIIKVIASGLVSLAEPERITPGGLNREELFLAVQEAANYGLAVMAHANGADAIKAAVEAGVRSVEHGFFMDDGALDVMASTGTYWTPTASALVRAARAVAITPEMQAFIDQLIHRHRAMILKAHRAGVPLVIGTDCVLPVEDYEARYHEELYCFEQAGIAREEVERIARINGARLLGIDTQGQAASSR